VTALTEHLLNSVGWRELDAVRLDRLPAQLACRWCDVENPHGAWDVEICVNCGSQVSKHCAHEINTWNEEGTVLTCDNCGIDGT
jgi:hypothetical protein